MNIERLATLLTSGIKPAQAASILGCTPARISQLLKDSQELQNLIASKEAELQVKDVETETLNVKYQATENHLLTKIMEMSENAELRDLTNALRVVSERQAKLQMRSLPAASTNGVIINQNIVQLAIPVQALPAITVNPDNEITAINDKTLAPLPSQNVEALFKKLRGIQNGQAHSITEAEAGPAKALSA
jgi:hypothetical protein